MCLGWRWGLDSGGSLRHCGPRNPMCCPSHWTLAGVVMLRASECSRPFKRFGLFREKLDSTGNPIRLAFASWGERVTPQAEDLKVLPVGGTV